MIKSRTQDDFAVNMHFVTSYLQFEKESIFSRFFYIFYGIKKMASVVLLVVLFEYPRALCVFLFLI